MGQLTNTKIAAQVTEIMKGCKTLKLKNTKTISAANMGRRESSGNIGITNNPLNNQSVAAAGFDYGLNHKKRALTVTSSALF